MEAKAVDLKTRMGFMSLLVGDEIFKTIGHGQDPPMVMESWVVKIEPKSSGDIPKMAIQQLTKDGIATSNEQIFFIHLNEDKKFIFDDNGKIFFDFTTNDEYLFSKR